MLLLEAATLKTRAQALLRDADRLLKDKTLPADVAEQLRSLRTALRKRWADLATDAATPAEAARCWLTEVQTVLRQADSYSATHQAVQAALDAAYPWTETMRGAYVRDLFDEQVVYSYADALWQADYLIADDGSAELGQPIEVEQTYSVVTDADVDAVEQADVDLTGDLVLLTEQAVKADGTATLKLIQPGWGSSGFYPAAVLERDGPKVFTKDLHMYWNHPTLEEDAQRPERDLSDLAATLTSDAVWQARGPAGPGLYADAKVFDQYAPAVEQLAPHIGVSIRAMGKASAGEADGQHGPIITDLIAAKSVDFVTAPGAGGQILQLFEAARGGARLPAPDPERSPQVDEREAQALREAASDAQTKLAEANTLIARLREGELLREARDLVTKELGAIELPDMTRARLTESLATNPPTKDGALDSDALKESVKKAAADELAYLQQVAGYGSGQIRGMGASGGGAAVAETSTASLAASLQRFGLSESAAKVAAAGRN